MRPQLDRSFVAGFRRLRITDALAASCETRGYAATTIDDIVRGAGVARQTLYVEFPNKDAVGVAMLERGHAELFGLVEAACGDEPGPEVIEPGLAAVLEWVAQDPRLARACLVERLGFERADDLQADALDRFAAMLRVNLPAAARRPELVDQMVVGGVESMLRYLLVAGRGGSAPSLLPSLLAFVRLPYEGGDWPTA